MNAGGRIVIMPVRSLRTGKSRLAGTTDEATRRELIRRMLAHVVTTCLDSRVFAEVAIISLDPDLLVYTGATWPAVTTLQQSELSPGLIPALELGRAYAAEQGYRDLTVLFADLPVVEAADLMALAAMPGQVVVAPDGADTGTNALVLRAGPADIARFAFQFGMTSFSRHLIEAERLGIAPVVLRLAGLAFDLDTPADLARLTATSVNAAGSDMRTGS